MDALELLLTRRSNKKLVAPAPQGEQLDNILQAALHAPDHGRLTPYRFVIIEKQGQDVLEQLLQSAVEELNLGEERKKKATDVSHRAPMIIAVIAKINNEIGKVPGWEQMLTAGCATYAMQLAANAQGFDNVWVSGPWIDGSELRQAFGCEAQDKVIALLMLGTAEQKLEKAKIHDVSPYVSYL
ncbi:NAD(P)H nitroreductase [Testudinibacter sp. TR-2022]|uniref:NAD(P)H nitroreductase n=1 Tax=Testudinibacter sp. TR-2022 TaxID=2585029 RepID=UPI00111A745F|nr:NAD(P)H nitroreductase [Testudinibacter sp. TR-2022]TNG95735.1 NAD(P)H nitroreductase [Pasteurellaceae bacterium UScroc12]TNG97504.1 NAD(P)H nitroreductase [Pasteurellaceae bacterium USgator41]TNG99406.1 NAD(P)H nitroreductase [Pasteurellaceae bacterium UScroc31]TNH00485.1 NAD(P)H nitroreductase [Pasteurellaceae bacterium USgator11]TNH07749.1 NAD(P)H nitroreductase [Pasteurellaceae bacterium Phil11]